MKILDVKTQSAKSYSQHLVTFCIFGIIYEGLFYQYDSDNTGLKCIIDNDINNFGLNSYKKV